MGPKRRSTEGAGSSSSSLLHKVARTPGRKGVRLRSQSKHIVENVWAFFEKEKACKSTINRMAVVKRTAEATGLSERTIRDIHKEHVARDGQLTPVKRYTTSRIRINPDTFDREAIRRLVHAFYIKREYPTIAAVLEKAKEECGFPGGRFCLWRVLKEMGFTYKKRDNKKYIYEQTNILEQRHTYLQTIRKLRQEHKNLVYTDETWVNAHHNN